MNLARDRKSSLPNNIYVRLQNFKKKGENKLEEEEEIDQEQNLYRRKKMSKGQDSILKYMVILPYIMVCFYVIGIF